MLKNNSSKKKKIKYKQTIKKITNDSICAPGKGNNTTCFDRKSLIKIASAWNKQSEQKINLSENSTNLWKQIHNKNSDKCSSELCWLKQGFASPFHNDFKHLFKPKIPSSWKTENKTWLSTTDIEKVLFQYQDAIKDFRFLGVVPIDFDFEFSAGRCVVDELCKININKLKKQKKINKIGIIFNLDAHDEPGSHWVALYSDFNKGEVYYYDSYGIFPPEEIKILMEKLSIQGIKIKGKPFQLYYNDIRHQYKNSECGVYSMHFITEFLNGKNFKDIIHNKITDDNMNKKRFTTFYNSL
jgi:hypothetical protein